MPANTSDFGEECRREQTTRYPAGYAHLKVASHSPDRRTSSYRSAVAAHERWSVRTLRAKIAGKLYERTIAARGSADGILPMGYYTFHVHGGAATYAETGCIGGSLYGWAGMYGAEWRGPAAIKGGGGR